MAEGWVAVFFAILGLTMARSSVWGLVLAGLMLGLIGAMMIPALAERRRLLLQIDQLQQSIGTAGFQVEVHGTEVQVDVLEPRREI